MRVAVAEEVIPPHLVIKLAVVQEAEAKEPLMHSL